MKTSIKYHRLIRILLPVLFVCGFFFNGHTQKGVKVKKHQFLVLQDTIIRPQDDTIIYIPANVEYKKRRDYEHYMNNRLVRQVWDQIYLDNPPLVDYDTSFTIESKNPYEMYEGKRIRNIYIKKQNVFSNNIYDTVYVKKREYLIEKVSEFLHEKTKTFVIEQNLFIDDDSIVDKNRLADNERLLRSLPYMHDARIFVVELPGQKNWVDVEVLVQDLWSIGGYFTPNDVTYHQWKLYDRNFLGYGQTLSYKGQYRTPRSQAFSSEIYYEKDNLMGTFINPFIMYSELNGGAKVGKQDETSFSIGAKRGIYMPTARLAGGYVFSNNKSVNTKMEIDTSYYNYRYNVNDLWGGITFSGFKQTGDDYDIITRQNRSRIFLSARYYNRTFLQQPDQPISRFIASYNNQTFVIGQATYFRYEFFKTRYLYGFGRTEDIPSGYSYWVNSGVDTRLDQQRYYLGIASFNSIVRPRGCFYLLDLRASAFYNHVHNVQDFFMKGEGTYISQVGEFGRWKARFYLTLNYAKIINPQLSGALNVNNTNGIQQFNSMLISGYQSSSVSLMTNLFPRFRFMGFRFAFILLTQFAQLGTETEFLFDNKIYTGFGGGFRTKNENLVFDEFECVVYWFPNSPEDVTTFKIVTTTSPRFRINLRGTDQPSFIGL
ncbi:hypothetical protein [Cytophaga hutchinsonii]|uniref:hypothetical protein n=1 Tax=Cytophaga hutchinsonii TaxID=985 RepID=UPI00031017DA|nr:hypothetical protein [Cytophaga hutchinsonii]SFX01513.1 hypothetical protein SAMN04487930_101190 [Cytophaga hutchinsonii ATCC 33406]